MSSAVGARGPKWQRALRKLVVYMLIIPGAILMAMPFVWLVLSSFKTLEEILALAVLRKITTGAVADHCQRIAFFGKAAKDQHCNVDVALTDSTQDIDAALSRQRQIQQHHIARGLTQTIQSFFT